MPLAKLGLLLVVAACAGFAYAAGEIKHGFLTNKVHHDADGSKSKYILFVPNSYDGQRPYPLILFLHGLGESGTDGHKQAEVGLGPVIKKRARTFPFFAIFPQSHKRSWQTNSQDAQRALQILGEVQEQYNIDPKRIYLTGLSMGGYGTWSLAEHYPERWAAIVPVCGGGDPKQASKIKDIPCWCFHGGADGTVRVAKSREMIKALEAAGGQPRYTEYPGVGHNSWDKAYGTRELFDWLGKQHLK